jgi:hypothetical protein
MKDLKRIDLRSIQKQQPSRLDHYDPKKTYHLSIDNENVRETNYHLKLITVVLLMILFSIMGISLQLKVGGL